MTQPTDERRPPSFYTERLNAAHQLTSQEIERMGLIIEWRGEQRFDRTGEPTTRAIVVRGQNGLFPGYIHQGNHVIFATITCLDVADAADHADRAMKAITGRI